MSVEGVIEADVDAVDTHPPNGNGSRFNAVKHGFSAKIAVLPGEDGEELHALVDAYKASLGTQNKLQDDLAECAARAKWRLERAERAEVMRTTRNIVELPAEMARNEKQDVILLGARLFFDRRGPLTLYGTSEYSNGKPRTSWVTDPEDPDRPDLLVGELESTLEGCRWLLARWRELRAVIEEALGWLPHQKFKAIRLLGKQPLDAADDELVAKVFLASHAIEPFHPYEFQELRSELYEDEFLAEKKVLKRAIKRLTPPNKTAARGVLLKIVDQATARLRTIEAKLQETVEIVNPLEKGILKFDESKAAEQNRRHQDNFNRRMVRNTDSVGRMQREDAIGWGKVRREREQRREQQEKAAIGAVPDFARWKAPADASDSGLARAAGAGSETFGRADGGDPSGARDPRQTADGGVAEPRETGSDGETLLLTETGERANNQNEIDEVDLSWAYEASAAYAEGRLGGGDAGGSATDDNGISVVDEGGVVEPRKAGWAGETLSVTQTGERANNQNEIDDVDLSWASETGAAYAEGRFGNDGALGNAPDVDELPVVDEGEELPQRRSTGETLLFTQTRERANNQNEIDHVDLSQASEARAAYAAGRLGGREAGGSAADVDGISDVDDGVRDLLAPHPGPLPVSGARGSCGSVGALRPPNQRG